jgi:sulfate adenylyltransferase subunit 1 (EFTu-like GTPase family)
LLYDTHTIMEDRFAAVKRACLKGGALETDLSLLTDGLEAEREQGINIHTLAAALPRFTANLR